MKNDLKSNTSTTVKTFQTFGLLALLSFALPSFVNAQSTGSSPMQKKTKAQGTELVQNFVTRNPGATVIGRTVTKQQLDDMIKNFPDCNAYSFYFGFDQSGEYGPKDQYVIVVAPAKVDSKSIVSYVADAAGDSSFYAPSYLCPNQCGLLQVGDLGK